MKQDEVPPGHDMPGLTFEEAKTQKTYDRLQGIKQQMPYFGITDEDGEWLIAEVERLQAEIVKILTLGPSPREPLGCRILNG
jgi:hypothetical protein